MTETGRFYSSIRRIPTTLYRLPDGTLFEATIEGVRPSGALLLRRTDGSLGEYLFREVEFVIAAKA